VEPGSTLDFISRRNTGFEKPAQAPASLQLANYR
jgi:hypothetical protein